MGDKEALSFICNDLFSKDKNNDQDQQDGSTGKGSSHPVMMNWVQSLEST